MSVVDVLWQEREMDAEYPYPILTDVDIRAMRRQAHLTREQVALALGYTVGHIDRFQSGETLLNDRMALKFLKLYMRTIVAHDEMAEQTYAA